MKININVNLTGKLSYKGDNIEFKNINITYPASFENSLLASGNFTLWYGGLKAILDKDGLVISKKPQENPRHLQWSLKIIISTLLEAIKADIPYEKDPELKLVLGNYDDVANSNTDRLLYDLSFTGTVEIDGLTFHIDEKFSNVPKKEESVLEDRDDSGIVAILKKPHTDALHIETIDNVQYSDVHIIKHTKNSMTIGTFFCTDTDKLASAFRKHGVPVSNYKTYHWSTKMNHFDIDISNLSYLNFHYDNDFPDYNLVNI